MHVFTLLLQPLFACCGDMGYNESNITGFFYKGRYVKYGKSFKRYGEYIDMKLYLMRNR